MKLNISYSCNEAYVQHTGISMISLFENNKDFHDIEVFLIEKDISQSSLNILKGIVNDYNRTLTIVRFEDICYDLNLKETGRHIETIYSKLFFTRLDGIDKIFYLDSDTVIVGSLKELWNIDMSDHQIAGVETFTVDIKEELGLLPEDKFINDGVALLNLEKLRQDSMLNKFLEFIDEHNGNPPLLSEGTINVVCKDNLLSLHPRFNLLSGLIYYKDYSFLENCNLANYYSKELISEAITNPIVIHYLAAFYNRPWDQNCTHPFKDVYLRYKSMSPWSDQELSDKKLSIRLRLIDLMYRMLPIGVYKFIKNASKLFN